MSKIQFLAAAKSGAPDGDAALQSLTDLIALTDTLKLENTNDHFIQFTGDKALVDRITAQFKDRLVIEQNHSLTLDDPVPSAARSGTATTDTTSGEDDDKDPNEIARF